MAEQKQDAVDESKPEKPEAEIPAEKKEPHIPGMTQARLRPIKNGIATKKASDVHISNVAMPRLLPVVKHGSFLASGDEHAARDFKKILGDLFDVGFEKMAAGLAFNDGRWEWATYGSIPEHVNVELIDFQDVINDATKTTAEKLDAARGEIAAELTTPAAAEKQA